MWQQVVREQFDLCLRAGGRVRSCMGRGGTTLVPPFSLDLAELVAAMPPSVHKHWGVL